MAARGMRNVPLAAVVGFVWPALGTRYRNSATNQNDMLAASSPSASELSIISEWFPDWFRLALASSFATPALVTSTSTRVVQMHMHDGVPVARKQ